MTLNDKTIDPDSALYWCAFCELSLKTPEKIQEDIMTRQTSAPKPNAWTKFVNKHLVRPKNELQYIAKGLDQETAMDIAQKTVDEYLKNPNSFQAVVASEAGQIFDDGKVKPGSNLVQAVAGLKTLGSGAGKDLHWWNRLGEVVGGYFADFKNWFMFGANSGELAKMNKLDKLEALLKNGGMHTAELIAAMYLLYKTREYTLPRLQLAWKNMKAGKALAVCEFKDGDGNRFQTWFDIKRGRWILAKKNGFFGAFTTSAENLFVKENEAEKFFSSAFFKKFVDRCREFIEPYLDVDPKSKTADSYIVKYVSANRNTIEKNMFGGMYAMFESSSRRRRFGD